jgi:hypothetical protein
MQRTITITYKWKRSGNKKIKPTHIEALEETAERLVFERLAEGCKLQADGIGFPNQLPIEGELQDFIHMNATDRPDGTEYNGWFTILKTR